MTEEVSTDDEEWGEEEDFAPAKPVKRRRVKKSRGGRWRFFAFGAAGGAALLAALALLGGGGGGRDRPLSPEAAAVFYAPPARPSGDVYGGLPPGPRGAGLETGDIRRVAGGLPPAPPLPAPPSSRQGGWTTEPFSGVVPHADDPPPSGFGAEFGSFDAGLGPAPGGSRGAPAAAAASASGPEADAAAAPRDPLSDLVSVEGIETSADADSGAAPAPNSAPAAAAAPAEGLPTPRPRPAAEPAAPPAAAAPAAPAADPPAAEAPQRIGEGAPLDSPAPRSKPPAPPQAPGGRSASEGPAQDPDVYSPPRRETRPQGAQDLGARGGWGARLRLDGGEEVEIAAAAPPPVHDPGRPSAALLTAMGPVYDPFPPPSSLPAAAPASVPATEASGVAERPRAGTPIIPASAEFGPELSAEAFAALDLSSEALATGELPKVRVAPIDSPEDGVFSARSETPSAAPAPRRRAASGPVLPKDSPRATVVLTALGLHEAITLRAMRDTPDEVALAFAPIGRRVGERVATLRGQGRVALVEAPMEAMSRAATPDDITLSTSVSAQENQARLARVLAAAPQASGVSTYMGARFTADSGALAGVLPLLGQRGLFVLENQPTNRSELRAAARNLGLRYAAAPVALDRETGAEAIRRALAALERQALADGEAVGVMAVSNEALDALALWSDGLAARGVRLAPLGEALE